MLINGALDPFARVLYYTALFLTLLLAANAMRFFRLPFFISAWAYSEKVAAVERAYRRHHPLVFRLAVRYGRGSRAWAEDLVQEVFVDLLHAIENLDELDALEGWLYRATSFRCLKQLRRERLMQSAPLRWFLGADEPRPAQPDAITFANDELKRAFQALETCRRRSASPSPCTTSTVDPSTRSER